MFREGGDWWQKIVTSTVNILISNICLCFNHPRQTKPKHETSFTIHDRFFSRERKRKELREFCGIIDREHDFFPYVNYRHKHSEITEEENISVQFYFIALHLVIPVNWRLFSSLLFSFVFSLAVHSHCPVLSNLHCWLFLFFFFPSFSLVFLILCLHFFIFCSHSKPSSSNQSFRFFALGGLQAKTIFAKIFLSFVIHKNI